MAIFDKPLSSLNEQDLQELIADEAVENVRLEFKREYPSKDELLKKLSSLANTYGGFVVIGAEASGKDGRIVALPGVEPKSGYKQTIVQWCTAGASPPLNVEVSDAIPIGSASRVCYVLFTQESDTAPHFLNGRKGVYVRTDEFSSKFEAQFATAPELRQLFDRRRVIGDRREALISRARERFDSLESTRFLELRTDKKESMGANFDITIVPRFPAQPLIDQLSLVRHFRSVSIPWRQVGFPRTSQATVSQHESVIALRPGSNFSILEANIWGMLFFASELERHEQIGLSYQGIHLFQFLGEAFVFTRYASEFLGQISRAGYLRVEIRMRKMRGVKWIGFNQNFPVDGPASELDDTIRIVTDIRSEQLRESPDDVALDLLKSIFSATNWTDLVQPTAIERLTVGAYEYNFWKPVARPASASGPKTVRAGG